MPLYIFGFIKSNHGLRKEYLLPVPAGGEVPSVDTYLHPLSRKFRAVRPFGDIINVEMFPGRPASPSLLVAEWPRFAFKSFPRLNVFFFRCRNRWLFNGRPLGRPTLIYNHGGFLFVGPDEEALRCPTLYSMLSLRIRRSAAMVKSKWQLLLF